MNIKKENRLLQIDIANSKSVVSRVIDTYVLLSVKLEKEKKVPHFYWRLQSSRHMIDIGLRSDTGELASMTIVLYRDLKHSSHPKMVEPERITEGIPVFSLDSWQIKDPYNNSEYYSIHNGEFLISLEKSDLWITLFSDTIESFVGLPGTILCLFNHKRELCGFLVENLTKQDIDKIRQFEKLWGSIDNGG